MMLHLFLEKGPWFRAKKLGYGAGLPFKWQGWVLLGAYMLTLVPLILVSAQGGAAPRLTSLTLILVVTAILLAIVRKRTEGGWKWRGG